MLDNFGLMEFLTLALMALLLFGPERLPQYAARLGRWLASLTRYSKAFMTQWSDEALAIQDAVAEVRGIRDEILSAQQEISGSLVTAREDITGAIGDARETVKQLTPNPQALLDGVGTTPAPLGASRTQDTGPTPPSGDDVAIAKSQQVLDELMKKRATTPAVQPGAAETAPVGSVPSPITPEQAAEQAAGPGGLAPDRIDLSKLNQEPETKQETESAFDRTQRVLNRLLGKEEPVMPAPSPAEQPATAGLPVPAATEEAIVPLAGATAETQPVASEMPQSSEPTATLAPVPVEPPAIVQPLAVAQPVTAEQVAGVPVTQEGAPQMAKEATESAFDRTQRVLDRLRGKKEPTATEPRTETQPLQPTSAAGQQVTQPVASIPAPGSRTERPEPAHVPSAAQRVGGLEAWVSYSRFEQLSIQVTLLQRELQMLRTEMQSMRTTQPQPIEGNADHGVSGVSSVEPAAASSASMPAEEIA